jgi:3'-5' exonuclease
MLKETILESILFLDIETVPQYESFETVPEKFQLLWEKKSKFFREAEQHAAEVYQRAGIYAEFGKIVCISAGMFYMKDGKRHFRVKSFFGEDERALLQQFTDMINKLTGKPDLLLCAHNGKEFDFPYIARRMLINGLPLPGVLNIAGKKPWEVKHLDTLELWKFGDYKNYTSLELLMAAFDIPSPKDDIDGSQVAGVYYEEKNIERIVRYCEKDVQAIAQLFLKYRIEEILPDELMESVTKFESDKAE